jgi:hypothetical protein
VSDIELANYIRILTEAKESAENDMDTAEDLIPYIENLKKAIADTEAVYVLRPKSSHNGTIYWYYLKALPENESDEGGYCLVNPNASGSYKNAAGVAEFEADNNNYLWAFVADNKGGFEVYNQGYDAYLYTNAKSPNQLKSDKAADAGSYSINVDNDKRAIVISEGQKYWYNNSKRVRVQNSTDCTYWKLELAGVEEGSLTSIVEVETEASNSVIKGIFDMTGRKIEEITKPGIYIIDGKKRLVK